MVARVRREDRPDGTFWVSYSDLATALLLVFVLILMVKSADADDKRQELDDLEDEVRKLLEQRETVAQRLDAAVKQTNKDLGREVFRYVDQRVEVSEQDVAWFEQGSDALTGDGRQQLGVFFEHLYDELLREGDVVLRPDFLETIDVLGHTDPTWTSGDDWTWESYENNLALSQGRALAVVRHIRGMYETGEQEERPWKPFVALLNASGRSWTRTYCDLANDTPPLAPDAFFRSPADPCSGQRTPTTMKASDERSRRVSFGFRLDDRAILEDLQRKLDAADDGR